MTMKGRRGEKELKLSYHQEFLTIALKNYCEVRTWEKWLEDPERIKYGAEELTDTMIVTSIAIEQASIATIIFSALTLEAFINHYAIEKFSRSYLKNHLDDLTTVNKWLLIPKLITGKSLATDGQAFEGLKKLFSRRNELVHYKTKSFKEEDIRNKKWWIKKKDAEFSLDTVIEVLKTFYKLDPDANMEWVNDAHLDVRLAPEGTESPLKETSRWFVRDFH